MNKYIPLTALVLAASTATGCDKIFPKNKFSARRDPQIVISQRVVSEDYERESIPTNDFSDVNPSIPFGRATSEFGVECYAGDGRIVDAASNPISILKNTTYTCRAANENASQAERIVGVRGLSRIFIDDSGNETAQAYTGFTFYSEQGRVSFALEEGMYRLYLTVGRFVPEKKGKTKVVTKDARLDFLVTEPQPIIVSRPRVRREITETEVITPETGDLPNTGRDSF